MQDLFTQAVSNGVLRKLESPTDFLCHCMESKIFEVSATLKSSENLVGVSLNLALVQCSFQFCLGSTQIRANFTRLNQFSLASSWLSSSGARGKNS